MKNPSKTTVAIMALAFLAVGVLAGRYLLPSHSEHAPAGEADAQSDAGADTTWTCSMHPSVQQSEPGDCPICGMDLIPMESDDDQADDTPRTLRMSESSRALAEIQTSLVEQAYPERSVRLVGKLAYDETRIKSLSARFPARIDELYVNYAGIRVEKGEHLAKIYSPELLTAQREFLTAHRSDPDSGFTRAAREKLRLWDLLPEQIDALLEEGVTQDHFVLKAPVGGVVVTQNVNEGDYMSTGTVMFRIVDLGTLWANLDAYESDLPWLRYGQEVTFTVEAFPGETFEGQIAFLSPEVDQKTRTIPIRVNIVNEEGRLKPGMFVRATVASRIGEDGRVFAPDMAGKWISPMHPEIVKNGPGTCDVCGMDLVPAESLGYVSEDTKDAPVVVPSSAVLRTGKRAVVYVEKPDADRPTYEGREIELGPRADDVYLVESGLSAGERVVTHGAFKIDSALQIQAKPSMMNPEEDTPGDGDAHAGHEMESSALTIPAEQAADLLDPYVAMQDALASDDLESARAQARAMMERTGHSGDLPALLHDMLAAESLDDFRLPHFEVLSNAMITALENNPEALSDELFVMNCPMVHEDRGADWIQTNDNLRNPYFGASMLKCGDTVKRLGTTKGTDD